MMNMEGRNLMIISEIEEIQCSGECLMNFNEQVPIYLLVKVWHFVQ